MRRLSSLATLIALGAVSGCGGGGGLSAKDYRAKADAICTTITSERDRLPAAQDLEQLKAVARSTLAINTDALRRFKALDPSGNLKAPHDVIVTRLGDTVRVQQQALKADPKSKAMENINVKAGEAHQAIIAAAKQAKLVACQKL
jgi:hypothetical protein